MLSPGRHELTLANRELGYQASRSVDIEPGEVRSITLDPRGPVNFNASPWAEVFIDGRKVGDTPIGQPSAPARHPRSDVPPPPACRPVDQVPSPCGQYRMARCNTSHGTSDIACARIVAG
jgi:hypothetical protein